MSEWRRLWSAVAQVVMPDEKASRCTGLCESPGNIEHPPPPLILHTGLTGMKMRYFVVDGSGVLRRFSRASVAELWDGSWSFDPKEFGDGARDLRLVSVLCGANIKPKRIYLLRVPMTRGRFTTADYLTLRVFTEREYVTSREVEEHHGAGWPSDLGRQLAVALDVTIDDLAVPLRVGGPLFVAVSRGVSPKEAVRFLR